MFRGRRFAKPVLVLIAAAAVAVVVSGCAFVKPGSLSVSQPGGVGTVRVHFVLCTVGGEVCGVNTESTETLQYLAGIAVPAGSTPPASFTATPVGAGLPITFTRDDLVASEMTASSATLEALYSTAVTPKEKEEAQQLKAFLGGAWPPAGLQGFGYISGPVLEVEGQNLEWSVDADFGVPAAAGGAPFTGPFATGIAFGFREVTAKQPASRPVHCIRFQKGVEPSEGDAFCGGTSQQGQTGTSDLTISAPKKTPQAFVGGSADVGFPLKFASTAASSPSFTLSATTTAKGGKAKPGSKSFKPGKVNAKTHLAPNATGDVTVSVPRGIKPGTYKVTLAAKTAQGGTATGTAKFKVVKPKLKLGAARANANGTATLKVKVPGAGKLTVSGKGIATVRKKAKKAKTLSVTITPTGAGGRVKVKATFKPTSGISVSKSKTIQLP
jgi:hypothetical protein